MSNKFNTIKDILTTKVFYNTSIEGKSIAQELSGAMKHDTDENVLFVYSVSLANGTVTRKNVATNIKGANVEKFRKAFLCYWYTMELEKVTADYNTIMGGVVTPTETDKPAFDCVKARFEYVKACFEKVETVEVSDTVRNMVRAYRGAKFDTYTKDIQSAMTEVYEFLKDHRKTADKMLSSTEITTLKDLLFKAYETFYTCDGDMFTAPHMRASNASAVNIFRYDYMGENVKSNGAVKSKYANIAQVCQQVLFNMVKTMAVSK